MSSIFKFQSKFAVRQRKLYIALRRMREKAWLVPGIGRYAYPTPEIDQLEQIIGRSSPSTLHNPPSGPKILIFTFRGGWSTNLANDIVVAEALRLRGARPHFVLCSSHLPVCDIANSLVAPPMPCDFCRTYPLKLLNQLNFPITTLNQFVSQAERQKITAEVAALTPATRSSYTVNGLPVGASIHISLPRFLLRGSVDDSDYAQDVWRRFLISAGIMALALPRLLAQEQPDQLWTMNGLFFSEQILHQLAQQAGIPWVNYETGFFPHTLVISRNQIANHYKLDTHWEAFRDVPLTAVQEQRVVDYLAKRRFGQDASITALYYPKLESSRQAIIQQLELDPTKPLVLLLTNILWDSAALGRDTIFNNLSDWLETTISHFIAHPTHQLIVRIHPAEVGLTMRESQEPIEAVIRQRFPELPNHIKVVEATSDLSSYTLMDMAEYGLVYTSTTGLEMALWGKPVVVAGETHYMGKGFTHDPLRQVDYLDWLANPTHLTPPTEAQLQIGRRYAHLFFFRMMYPFPHLTTLPQRRIQFHFEQLDELAPSRNIALDHLCQEILHGSHPGMILSPEG